MKKGLMTNPAHKTKLFQNFIFYLSSKIVNTINEKKYNLKITMEKGIALIYTLLL